MILRLAALVLGVLQVAAPAVFLLSTSATAQLGQNAGVLTVGTPAPTYQGPGDVISGIRRFYSTRAISNAYAVANGNILAAKQPGGAGCQAISANNGDLDIATTYCPGSTSLATFCSGGCTVQTWTDQTNPGVHDATNVTLAKQPTLTFSAANGHACLTWSGGQNLEAGNNGLTLPQPYTWNTVGSRTAAFTTQQTFIHSTANVFIGPWSVSGQYFAYAGTVWTGAASDTTLHSVSALYSGASSILNVDGTDGTAQAGGSNAPTGSDVIDLGSTSTTAFPLTGLMCEAFTASDTPSRSTIHTSQSAWFGTP